MTLLELLVQELPKRGGWPYEVYSISQFRDGELCYHDKDGSCSDACTEVYLTPHEDGDETDWAYGVYVTREQYEAAMQKVEWDGNYPIKPGTDVEVHFDGDDCRVWTEFRVEYMRGDVVVLHDYRVDDVTAYCNARLNFRPIRSEADKKRDAAVCDMFYALPENLTPGKDVREAIYDAIAAGKIPGVRIE